jgi:hypothetical protein
MHNANEQNYKKGENKITKIDTKNTCN